MLVSFPFSLLDVMAFSTPRQCLTSAGCVTGLETHALCRVGQFKEAGQDPVSQHGRRHFLIKSALSHGAAKPHCCESDSLLQ